MSTATEQDRITAIPRNRDWIERQLRSIQVALNEMATGAEWPGDGRMHLRIAAEHCMFAVGQVRKAGAA